MGSPWVDFFRLPDFGDALEQRRGLLVFRTSRFMAAGAMCAGLVLLIADPKQAASVAVFYGVAAAFCLWVMKLVRSGHVVAAGWLLTSGLWSVVTSAVFLFGGVEVGRAAALMLVVVLAGLCVNGRAGIVVAAASIAAAGLSTYMEVHGWLPVAIEGTNATTETVAFSTVVIVLGLVVSLATRTTEEAIGRFLHGRDELEGALDELRASRRGFETNAQRSSALAELGRTLVGHLDDWPRIVADTLVTSLDVEHAGLSFQSRSAVEGRRASSEGAPDPSPERLEAAVRAPPDALGLVAVALPGGRARGYVWAATRPQTALSALDRDFLRTVAAMVSGVLDREFVEQRAREAQKLEAVGRLAGSVAHDFNNVLTTILVSSELALEDIDEADGSRRYLEDIARAGRHAGALVAHLAAFNRHQPSVATAVDVGSTVRNAISMLERLAGERHRVVIEEAGPKCRAVIDVSQLEQVLLNLVSNARDAMPEGGTIRVRVRAGERRGASMVHIEVEDEGEGMSEDLQAHVFEQFFTTKSNGTGLGLASVRQIVDGLGGHVELMSRLGEGTCVRLSFPLTDREPDETDVGTRSLVRPEGALCVLLVDDHPGVRRTIRLALTAMGHQVTEASTGADALGCLDAAKHDVVLSDIVMPGIDGFELRRRIAETTSVPVLLMSGFARSPDAEGQADLVKPFKVGELRAALASIKPSRSRGAVAGGRTTGKTPGVKPVD